MERPLPSIPGTEEFEDNYRDSDDDNKDDDEDDSQEDYYSIIPQQQPICLQLDPLESDNDSNGAYLTPLRELATAHKLPITVRVGCASEDHIIAEGDLMVLHFITWRQRIFAKYDDGTEVLLPVHASQLYDVLPEERVHDDVVFHSTRDVINSEPLPKRVRVICSDNSESQYSNFGQNGDIINVSHVGQVEVYGFTQTTVLVGTCNDSPITIDENLKCVYTTMVEPESQTLYQILAKHSLPLRLRQSHDRAGLVLTASREEAHVIATHVASRKVLSIPVDGPISLRRANDESSLSDAISPLYPLVNCTVCDWEYGRPSLSKNLQEIPEPLEHVSRQWIHSDDGKMMMRKILQEDCPCEEKKRWLASKEQGDMFEGKEQGLVKKKSSFRDKFKQLKIRRRSSEPSNSYDYLERPMEMGDKALTKLHEMKSLLTRKEVETRDLRKENDILRMETKGLQERISQLSDLNRRYLDKLNKMYIQNDDVKGSQKFKSNLATSNNYVGITNANNAINSSTSSSSTNQRHFPKEESTKSISVSRKIPLQSASVEEVGQFLRDLKLDKYIEIFREEDVNGKLLLDLDFDTLIEDLNMSRIHAKRLNLAIMDEVGET